MAAHRALAEDNERARQNVRALDGDGDRQRLVHAPHEIARPEADAGAALHVHGVVHHAAHVLGELVLGDRRGHRRFLAQVHGARRERARGVHEIGVPGHARERFFHAFELADRQLELLADARVRAGGAAGELAGAGRERRQRNRTAGSEGFHQHAPALADLLRPADDPVERNEHVLAPVGAVLERNVERIVARADFDAGGIRRNQRQRDAEILVAAQQVVGVVELERQTEHRRHRPEGDVALFPVQPNAEHILFCPRIRRDIRRRGRAWRSRPSRPRDW